MLGYSDFMELANHILRGNQVIVRGSDVTTVTSIIDVLKVSLSEITVFTPKHCFETLSSVFFKFNAPIPRFPHSQDLVPASCCRIVGFSENYKESFVCNFLGVTVSVELPPHVVASELHVLLDILPPLGRHYSRLQNDPVAPSSSFQDAAATSQDSSSSDRLGSYKLMVYSAQSRTSEQKCEFM